MKRKSSESVDEQVPEHALIPPHAVKVHFKSRLLALRVDLVKVPEKFIDVDAREGHIVISTSNYSKKYYLRLEYPQSIRIDPEQSVAELEPPGILRIELPVTQILDKETGKLLRKKAKSNCVEGAKGDSKVSPISKKTKLIEGNSKIEFQTKRPAKKRRTESKEERSEAKVLDSLAIIEEINASEDAKRKEKLTKENEKIKAVETKEKAKRTKQVKERQLREAVVAKTRKGLQNDLDLDKAGKKRR